MPNAKDAPGVVKHKIMLIGQIGSGKTTQFLTLPGKKFAYLFDANAILTLQGHDLDYLEFLPDRLNAAATTLKGTSDQKSVLKSDLYQEFEKDFQSKIASGFFKSYDWLGFDSSTTLLDLLMDRVLTMNNRFGQWPQQDDYGPQMVGFINLVRAAVSQDIGIFFTAHVETKQDKTSKIVSNVPMMTGRLTAKIPLLFSSVFYTEVETDDKKVTRFFLQTKPGDMNKTIRTSIKNLDFMEDVTIDESKPYEGQGLGGIIQRDLSRKR